jgi:YVTN family beta-propeller protein
MVIAILLVLSSTVSVAYGSVTPERTFFSSLAVTIPDSREPVSLAYGSEAQPYQGFSEAAVVSLEGNVSFVGPAPSYFLNGSVASYGYSTSSYSVPVGFGAGKIIYVPEVNTFYVLNNGENRVIAFKGPVYMSNGTAVAAPQVVANLTTGSGPLDECYNPVPGGALVYVLNFLSQSIGVINATTNKVSGNLAASATSIACDLYNGDLFFTTSGGLLVQLNGTSGAVVASSPIAGSGGSQPITSLTFDPDNGLLYAVNLSKVIEVISPANLKVVDNVTTSGTPGPLAIDTSDNLVFASTGNQTLVLDGTTNAVIATISTSAAPYSLAVDPFNKYLYVDYESEGSIAVYAFSVGPPVQTGTTAVTTTVTTTSTSISTATATTTSTSVQTTGTSETAALLVLLLVVIIESVYLGFGLYRRSQSRPS